jgi:outer membrane biosynthesis protein TonB
MSRHSLWSVGLLVLLLLTVGNPAPWGTAAAQPPAESAAIDPLDLARGLREQGMADLALEYLQEIEKKPGVSDDIKSQIPLERAKCQLDAAVDEPDEGTRISLIGEAKEGFFTFVRNPKNAKHPRMPEAFLALARLTSLDAKSQLSKANKIDVPQLNEMGTNQAEVDEANAAKKKEAEKARPIFKSASDLLKSAVKQLQDQLEAADPARKKAIQAAMFEAEIARGTNQLAFAETFIGGNAEDVKERSKAIDEAQDIFANLIKAEGATAATTGLARAWVAECYNLKQDFLKAEEEEKRIEASTGAEADEAKRMVKFFRLRRMALAALSTPNDRPLAETRCREWLRQYGSLRRGQNETYAVRWYLGLLQRFQADALAPLPKVQPKTPQPLPPLNASARARYTEAEKLFRQISQSDNEYTDRAARQRMYVVRRLLGEKDLPAGVNAEAFEKLKDNEKAELPKLIAEYPLQFKTFEDCQMAALIQMARTLDLQKDAEKNKEEIKTRQRTVVALLERARELATSQDNPADVADVNLRLIYFYQITDQPYLAAVLGEHMARTTKAPGGKSALAGALGINGYFGATAQIKNAEAEKLDGLRKTDRDLAIRLAQFVDKQFPNDTATDRARHRLAGLLYEDQRPLEAYDTLLKIRAGYDGISQARLFQGAVASQLLLAKDIKALDDKRKQEIYRRTTSDLDKLVKPLSTSPEEEVRPYISARCRLAMLYVLQSRVDASAEKLEPGYIKARRVADETLAAVPTFNVLLEAGTKNLNLDGWELKLLAEDAQAKTAWVEGNTLFAAGKYDEAYKAIGGILAEMSRTGTFADQVKPVLAAGPKPPMPKEPEKKDAPAPKKEEPKKDEPKKDEPKNKEAKPEPEPMGEKDENKAQKDQISKLADGVDKYRQNLIVLALKIRVKKGEAEKGIEQIELLKRFGGSIESNIATLEQITAEMAGQIVALKRDGKAEEAKSLSDGFSKLLDKVSAEPGLPASVQRFLGQSLIIVGQYPKAIDALKKVPPPKDMAMLGKLNEIADPAEKRAVLEYRRAQLELIRAYRMDKQFPAAEAVVAATMGTKEKPGWAMNSSDFRKEKAFLHEAKGASIPPPDPQSKKAWGEAAQEWTSLVRIYQLQLQNAVPGKAGGGGNARLAALNNYLEAYLDHQRCVLHANQHLLPKGDPKFTKMYDDTARNFATLEMINGRNFNTDVRDRYHDTITEIPELKAAYEKAVATALGTAKQKAEDREKDAAAFKKQAEALPPDSPERMKFEFNAKELGDDAAWIRQWAESGGKMFLAKPNPMN